MKRRIVLATLVAAFTPHAFAEAYPERPVKLIVPYAPGGTTDLLARIVAAKLHTVLKQPFVVENRPGAGGSVGSGFAAKQPADGYTLVMMVESSHAVNPNVYAKSPYDPVKDFAPISNIADVPNVLVANPSVPVTDVPGLIKELKLHPQKYSFGSSGNGGLSHLNGELFKHVTGTSILHVPYKGLGPALTDLMSGQLALVFDNIPSSAELIQAGRIRPLAITGKQRLKLLPQVPTYAELGLPAMNNASWFGLGAPAQTPVAVLDRLNAALHQVLADTEAVAAIERLGAIPRPTSREEFSKHIINQNEFWKKTVKEMRFEKL